MPNDILCDGNVMDCDIATKEESSTCAACESAATLDVLKDVQKAYEERMEVIERIGGLDKVQKQVDVLKSWVSDLVAQNTLLAKVVQELEAEASTRLLYERKKRNEITSELRMEVGVLRRRLHRKDSDLRSLIEVLRRIREFDFCTLDGIHFFEVTESEIFGSAEWRKKLEQGDIRRNFSNNNFKNQVQRNRKNRMKSRSSQLQFRLV